MIDIGMKLVKVVDEAMQAQTAHTNNVKATANVAMKEIDKNLRVIDKYLGELDSEEAIYLYPDSYYKAMNALCNTREIVDNYLNLVR